MSSKHPALLEDIFNPEQELGNIKVPSYQRAYAWEEEHLKAFISDLLEIAGAESRTYYYGHFVLEKTTEGYTNVIDGQQRITTFILFLLVCYSLETKTPDSCIDCFETVDYDASNFKNVKQIIKNNREWDLELMKEHLDKHLEATLSIERILFALDYFRKAFEGKSGPTLEKEKIPKYINVLKKASISCHIVADKAVAAQIFELHNSRGAGLTTLEKVKSKLMKAAYVCGAPSEKSEAAVSDIQIYFAEIYRHEDSLSKASFIGKPSLERLLFHHLRVVDDEVNGNSEHFYQPGRSGEESILDYIGKRLLSEDVLAYTTNLARRFAQSVKFVSKTLPKMDESNSTIGDVMILDSSLSTELFLMLHHKDLDEILSDSTITRLWEKLLFVRDFHDKYYRKWYGDNFKELFYKLTNVNYRSDIVRVLSHYLEKGFQPRYMEQGSLRITVDNYLTNNKEDILNRAFNFCQNKAKYILYKYELKHGANLKKMRAVIKDGISVEHTLPQTREWKWIGEDAKNVSEKGRTFNESVKSFINGIGNLLILSSSENSRLSNAHPKDKVYSEIGGGSYQQHNASRHKWENPENWASLIQNRGESIYSFLEAFVKPPVMETVS